MNVSTSMASSSSSQAPAKKQRRDDEKPPSGDKGAVNLISLTRRRVWRACESCRQVTLRLTSNDLLTKSLSDARRSSVTAQSRSAANVSKRVPTALGYKLKIGQLSADSKLPVHPYPSQYLTMPLSCLRFVSNPDMSKNWKTALFALNLSWLKSRHK